MEQCNQSQESKEEIKIEAKHLIFTYLVVGIILMATNKNIAKFCVERSFSIFVREAVKKHQLDMNFTDKDGQTLLDYIMEAIDFEKRSSHINEDKINEFKMLYDLLRENGAKHANEL